MTPWQIYWLTRCEPLAAFFRSSHYTLFWATIILGAVVAFFGCMWADLQSQKITKGMVRTFCLTVVASITLSFVSLFLSVMLPSRTDIAIILAGSWVTNNEEMQKLPDNVLGVVNKYLEGYLQEDKAK